MEPNSGNSTPSTPSNSSSTSSSDRENSGNTNTFIINIHNHYNLVIIDQSDRTVNFASFNNTSHNTSGSFNDHSTNAHEWNVGSPSPSVEETQGSSENTRPHERSATTSEILDRITNWLRSFFRAEEA